MIDETHVAALRDSHPTVVAAGSYIMDVLGRPVAELPRGQHSLLLDEIRATPAGTAGGTAVDLARLEREALAFAGDSDCISAARRLRDLGAHCVIVKRGADGCLIVDDDGARTLPAQHAPVVDTTGCADAFCAGVIAASCAGWTVDEAARLGCATGALNLRALGSDAGARDVDEAVAYMRDAPHRTERSAPGDPTLGALHDVSKAKAG